MQQLPFFVYGTLQTGFKNNTKYVRDRLVLRSRGQIRNAHLYHYSDARHPGLYEGSPKCPTDMRKVLFRTDISLSSNKPEALPFSGFVVGQVLDFPDTHKYPDLYDNLLKDLDQLEGYRESSSDNVYDRVKRFVEIPSGEDVLCWVYISRIKLDDNAVLISDGDWRAFMMKHGFDDMN